MEFFELTEDHIKLFKRMYVDWDDCEYGAPAINPKRPYGNSDVEYDIATILDWDIKATNYEEGYLDADLSDKAFNLHQDMKTALQVILSTCQFKLGTYVKTEKYDDTSWKYVGNEKIRKYVGNEKINNKRISKKIFR